MDKAKVIESLNKAQAVDFINKLLKSKLKILVLFAAFPITAAANISDPRQFLMVKNLEALLDLKKADLN
ncbi:MAG: hypothetical protein FD145_390 [Candidatus Saganbacteria bacterium]|uniref:Uncharacterized protein n=1 Tax=Candidatus Saganbacteria bacterium TaxID=2575572 RepID=A0A833L1Z2_UNCSA|nr:MAG: hypothetical protein FD145_390 [Candidatus Saganbacteria bacterium]